MFCGFTGHYFALIGPEEDEDIEIGLTYTSSLDKFPVLSIPDTVDNLETLWLPGTTLLFDFPFPAFPDHIGHYAELLIPAYSEMLDGTWKEAAVNG